MSFYDGDVLDNTDEMECNNYVEFLFQRPCRFQFVCYRCAATLRGPWEINFIQEIVNV